MDVYFVPYQCDQSKYCQSQVSWFGKGCTSEIGGREWIITQSSKLYFFTTRALITNLSTMKTSASDPSSNVATTTRSPIEGGWVLLIIVPGGASVGTAACLLYKTFEKAILITPIVDDGVEEVKRR